MEEWKGEGEDGSIAHWMAMLTSWLPLLCRASNGVGTSILSSGERVEMVRVLEEIIEKLSWQQQEEVLALWLHHFTSCSDSDWPNLVSCYTRWYSESRKFLLKWPMYIILCSNSTYTYFTFSAILGIASMEDLKTTHRIDASIF